MNNDILSRIPSILAALRGQAPYRGDRMLDAASLIEALQYENRRIRDTCYSQATVETLMADLARVTAERNELKEELAASCADCCGITYRQTRSGKIIPASLVCSRKTDAEPLTADELREMSLFEWAWVECLTTFDYHEKVSGYYRKHHDYTRGEAFCCGYPGMTLGFDYADYGKTWLAYRRKPEEGAK